MATKSKPAQSQQQLKVAPAGPSRPPKTKPNAGAKSEQPSRAGTSISKASEKKELNFDVDDGTCSLVIKCRGTPLYCHKDYLCIWSPVIKAKCNPQSTDPEKTDTDGQHTDTHHNEHNEEITYTEDGLMEIALDEEPADIKEFLCCLYPQGHEIDSDNAEQVSALAHVYVTDQLKQKCEQFLIDHRHPTMELMVMAENYEMEKLREHIAKRMGERPLVVIEDEGEFEELNEESRMMVWRERALALEAQKGPIDEVAEAEYSILKFVVKGSKGTTIPEEKFGNVTQFSKDAKGRKVKEVIPNACMVQVSDCDPNSRKCLRNLAKNVLDKMQALDDLKAFEFDQKLSSDITHVHFHPFLPKDTWREKYDMGHKIMQKEYKK